VKGKDRLSITSYVHWIPPKGAITTTMKYKLYLAIIFAAIFIPFIPAPAHALSCLPVDMYLKDVVGKDGEITIVVGTVQDQVEASDYTGEVLNITEIKQGYAEKELFVYHQKSIDWGYFCNAGPAKEGEKSVYLLSRDAYGKVLVTQRLSPTDPLAITLLEDLKKAEIEGSLSDITAQDRQNQIMTTIQDLFKQINILFKEYLYWKTN
jgi:hypothetical protein